MKKCISTAKAPVAVGPYSQAVEANGFLFVSGQLPLVPDTGKIVDGGIKEQTQQALINIQNILIESGYSLFDVVKTTVLLSDINYFSDMNKIYAEFFGKDEPARAAFAVKGLPLGALVEIETIAAKQ